MEVNPVLISEYKKSKTLRRTKTDSVDCESIARWLMTVEYKPHSKGFYHAYSLKSLTRLRDKLIRQRSFYLVKITNVLDHTFPEFKPFFNERLSKTALYLLENYGSAEKMARMNSASYEKLRSVSRGKFSPQQFLRLKELAANTVGVNNSIFDVELNSLLSLYKSLVKEIDTIEKEINKLIEEVHPHYMSVPGIGPLSAAVIYSEYGDISNFTNPGQMLAFAGIEPGINESGTESHGGKMVKRGSSQLCYTLINWNLLSIIPIADLILQIVRKLFYINACINDEKSLKISVLSQIRKAINMLKVLKLYDFQICQFFNK